MVVASSEREFIINNIDSKGRIKIMIKRFLLPLIIVALVAFGVTSCGTATATPSYNYDDDNMVAYYGCPNSKKVKKLNLMKRLIRK